MNTLLGLLLLLSQDSGPAAEVEVRARLERDSVRLGEPIALTVAVSGLGPDQRVSFPELPDTGALIALGPPRVDADAPAGSRRALYQLAAWQLGELALPDAEVTVIGDGLERSVALPGVTVHVVSVLPAAADADTVGYQPPADVIGGNWSLGEKLIALALTLALFAVGALYLRRRNVAQPLSPPPTKTPRERALEAFDELSRSGLIQAGELKGFYSALSHVLRGFLAESDPAWGLDLTSREILAAIEADAVRPEAHRELRVLLEEADQVKFARRRPSRIRAERALEAARDWVADFDRLEPPTEAEGAVEAEDGFESGGGADALAEMESVFAGEPFDGDGDGEGEGEDDGDGEGEDDGDGGRR